MTEKRSPHPAIYCGITFLLTLLGVFIYNQLTSDDRPLIPRKESVSEERAKSEVKVVVAPTFNQAVEQIRDLIISHNEASNLNGDARTETAHFASEVNFFGSTITRAAVLKDFTNYANKWSVKRHFVITGGRSSIKVEQAGEHDYRVTVPKSYTLQNAGGKYREGKLTNTFSVRFNDDVERFEITGIKE